MRKKVPKHPPEENESGDDSGLWLDYGLINKMLGRKPVETEALDDALWTSAFSWRPKKEEPDDDVGN